MSDETHNPDPQSEELVAYLDGELDADARRQVEQRLASDPAARQELQRLERVWDLLDRLPRATASESFTGTTVEMISLAAAEDVDRQRATLPKRHATRWLAGALATVAAGVTGALVVAQLTPNPNKVLIRDLPVLENLELYRQADSIEFLKKLHDEGLFGEDDDAS